MESRNRAGKTGSDAESAVAAELEARGFHVVARNYHSRYGEVDIIAEKDGCLSFIEVKCRRSTAFGTPAEAVTIKKQRKIIKTAGIYLLENGIVDKQVRFDVAEVSGAGGEIRLIESAFDLTSSGCGEEFF